MIRSVGRAGPIKVAARVLWQLKYNLLAVLVVALILIPIPDTIQSQNATAVLSTIGIAASIFIGFRNTNAYNRWWEARTLWGGIINDSRSLHDALSAVDTGTPAMAAVLDRMRHRQVRYAWQLTAELRRDTPRTAATGLTDDPPDAGATTLMNLQAKDIRQLAVRGDIDPPTRVMLVAICSRLTASQGGLERIRNQPFPVQYDMFIRLLAWVFALVAFNRMDASTHYVGSILIGLVLMVLFVSAERLGSYLEQPMTNSMFDLPMNRFCATITGDLLGSARPLAAPRESDAATVWM